MCLYPVIHALSSRVYTLRVYVVLRRYRAGRFYDKDLKHTVDV